MIRTIAIIAAILWALTVPLVLTLAAAFVGITLRAAYTMFAFHLYAPAVPLSIAEGYWLAIKDFHRWITNLF